jgi:hypothetical protein
MTVRTMRHPVKATLVAAVVLAAGLFTVSAYAKTSLYSATPRPSRSFSQGNSGSFGEIDPMRGL